MFSPVFAFCGTHGSSLSPELPDIAQAVTMSGRVFAIGARTASRVTCRRYLFVRTFHSASFQKSSEFKVLEVEKKFLPTPEVLKSITALTTGQNSFELIVDSYFDNDACSLTSNDFWFRQRYKNKNISNLSFEPIKSLSNAFIAKNANFELKYPSSWNQTENGNSSHDSTIDSYREVNATFGELEMVACDLLDLEKLQLSLSRFGTIVTLRETRTLDLSEASLGMSGVETELSVVVDHVAFGVDEDVCIYLSPVSLSFSFLLL